jgi:hypothetical protein
LERLAEADFDRAVEAEKVLQDRAKRFKNPVHQERADFICNDVMFRARFFREHPNEEDEEIRKKYRKRLKELARGK